jgi:hypothetical protein
MQERDRFGLADTAHEKLPQATISRLRVRGTLHVPNNRTGRQPYAPIPAPRDKNRDRYAPRPDDAPAIAAWRERMGSQAAKDIYKERAARHFEGLPGVRFIPKSNG